MQQAATDALLRSLSWLQSSGEYSDLKVFSGDQVFSAHKALVCSRSAFFAQACVWGKDGQSKGEVDLGEDDPKIVKLMLDYLYQLDYDDVLPGNAPLAEESIPKEPDSPVVRTVKFFESIGTNGEPVETPGDSTDVRVPWDFMLTLKEKRRREKQMRLDGTWDHRLTREMIDEDNTATAPVYSREATVAEPVMEFEAVAEDTETWSFPKKTMNPRGKARLQNLTTSSDAARTVVNADMYALADKYGIEDLKLLARAKFSKAAAEEWRSEGFVRAAELAFQNTPGSDSGLRSIVVSTILEHQELTDYEEVRDLLDSGNGIAWQLLKAFLTRL